jgi:hypothetical protein
MFQSPLLRGNVRDRSRAALGFSALGERRLPFDRFRKRNRSEGHTDSSDIGVRFSCNLGKPVLPWNLPRSPSLPHLHPSIPERRMLANVHHLSESYERHQLPDCLPFICRLTDEAADIVALPGARAVPLTVTTRVRFWTRRTVSACTDTPLKSRLSGLAPKKAARELARSRSRRRSGPNSGVATTLPRSRRSTGVAKCNVKRVLLPSSGLTKSET